MSRSSIDSPPALPSRAPSRADSVRGRGSCRYPRADYDTGKDKVRFKTFEGHFDMPLSGCRGMEKERRERGGGTERMLMRTEQTVRPNGDWIERTASSSKELPPIVRKMVLSRCLMPLAGAN